MTLLPFIVLIGAMFLMTRSAKNKQRQATQMRDQMQPGTGIRTIGGMYATVKEINPDTVLLEVAPGVHAVYAKNSIGAVLEDSEYNRIVHGIEPEVLKVDTPVVPDDASSLTEAGEAADAADAADAEPVTADDAADSADKKIDLGKADAAESENESESESEKKDAKNDGDADAK